MLASNTNLDKCYQLLGLDREASLDRVKSAYRSLARKFHPDLNPNDVQAHQRFITLNQAYQLLLDSLPVHSSSPPAYSVRATPSPTSQTTAYPAQAKTATPTSTPREEELKWELYYELQSLLKKKQFLKAIVLIEGLAQRFSLDPQICQWQGIIYSQFGNELFKQRDFEKARIYLTKALRVDPHNRQLGEEVDLTLTRIAKLS
jgi:tetratricopeptide (TPR) repeat protein